MSPVALLALGALAAALAHGSHRALAALPAAARPAADILPSATALRRLALGYRELMADGLWLRCIAHFGDRRAHAAHYPSLGPLLERVVALDPKFVSAYLLTSAGLTLAGADHGLALRLLERGSRERPEVGRLHFLYGFNAYYLAADHARAAAAMARAARLPGTPDYIAALATRLAAEAGTPETGLAMVDALLADRPPAALAELLETRRRLLQLEVHLHALQEAARAYRANHGRPAPSLEALVAAGLIDQVPADPLGGSFSMAADGQIVSQHEAERLRLSAAALPPPTRVRDGHAGD